MLITSRSSLLSAFCFRTLDQTRRTHSTGVPLSFIKVKDNTKLDESKSPLLIFHGLFGSKTNWRSISKHLATRTGRTVFAFDLRNHGDSPHVDGHKSDLSAMACDIDYFMHLNHLDKVTLLGHSLGGRVAAQFAFNSPEKVDKLILVDITVLNNLPTTNFMSDQFFNQLKASVDDLPAKLDLTTARKQVSDKLMPLLGDKFIVDFFLLSLYKEERFKWRFNVDALRTLIVERLITNLQIPKPFEGDSLLIYGEKSNYVREEDFDKIKIHLPSIRFIPIADAGHYLHIEKSNLFMDHIVDYLQ